MSEVKEKSFVERGAPVGALLALLAISMPSAARAEDIARNNVPRALPITFDPSATDDHRRSAEEAKLHTTNVDASGCDIRYHDGMMASFNPNDVMLTITTARDGGRKSVIRIICAPETGGARAEVAPTLIDESAIRPASPFASRV